MGSLQLHLADLVFLATWDKSGVYIHVYYSGKSSRYIHVDIWDISGINRHTPDLHQFPRFTPDIHVDIWGCACWDTMAWLILPGTSWLLTQGWTTFTHIEHVTCGLLPPNHENIFLSFLTAAKTWIFRHLGIIWSPWATKHWKYGLYFTITLNIIDDIFFIVHFGGCFVVKSENVFWTQFDMIWDVAHLYDQNKLS